MKKLIALSLLMFLACTTLPAFADGAATASSGSNVATGDEQVKNVQTGGRNLAGGWVDALDATHEEAAKGKDPAEQITGVVAGGAIGVRRTIHRMGAGAIDLLTFWIPKKQPLISPEKPRLE